MKPRIYRSNGVWCCTYGGFTAKGASPFLAYDNWRGYSWKVMSPQWLGLVYGSYGT